MGSPGSATAGLFVDDLSFGSANPTLDSSPRRNWSRRIDFGNAVTERSIAMKECVGNGGRTA
jgi:hypothetical protein